jgi:hypothetical protein
MAKVGGGRTRHGEMRRWHPVLISIAAGVAAGFIVALLYLVLR